MASWRSCLALFILAMGSGCTRSPCCSDGKIAVTVPAAGAQEMDCDFDIAHYLQSPLTLEHAVQLALINNPRLRAEFYEIGIARADLIEAGLFQNPAFDLFFRIPDREGLKNNVEFSVITSFLDIVRIPLRRRVAGIAYEQAQLRVDHAVLGLVFDVEEVYYKIQAEQKRLASLLQLFDLAGIVQQLSVQQSKNGSINSLELQTQSARYVDAKLELEQTRLELATLKEKMNQLLGLSCGLEWTLEPALPAIPGESSELESLMCQALAERRDLAAARKEVERIASMYPLKQWWEYTNGQAGIGCELDTDGVWTRGPAIVGELPLFNYGQADRARLCAQFYQAQQRVAALEVAVVAETRAAWQQLQSYRRIAGDYRDYLLPLKKQIVSLSEKLYRAMALSLYVLLQSKENEIRTQGQYDAAVRDYWLAHVALERAVGGKL